MTQTTTQREKGAPLNGVDTPTLFATIDAVDGQRELAQFRFRATTEWQSGTHSRTRFRSFYGAGGEHEHVREFVVDADHPQVLVGADNGPLPVELVLAGLTSCLMGGIGNIAAARGVELHEVEAKVEGEMNLEGILGLSDEVRNGYERIRVSFTIKGDAPAEKLQEIVEQSKARSAVYDIITNRVPVELTVDAG
ncbi:MAG: OsmC family peroxiredoxin [Gemmatimonadetes bacterium]|nr:OsmC family protein [Gemmatimonadota bacterium]NIR78638.1 OsmC family protein [Gemmatimonadota bacterium]NIT87256.1 OsmC family protein [Gemmatimonadota bacterium]NIU31099.1 OsmC family protein [Gemmatimonadota bacterium]NIU35835.1 OsmC family peroxiredoxin [Gemmatimonadota bacterium]